MRFVTKERDYSFSNGCSGGRSSRLDLKMAMAVRSFIPAAATSAALRLRGAADSSVSRNANVVHLSAARSGTFTRLRQSSPAAM